MKRLIALVLTIAFCTAPAIALADGNLGGDRESEIDRYIEQTMEAGRIPGLSVAIVQEGEVVYLKGFSTADGTRPVTPQTPFTICSVGKTFTALAIRQLAGQGKVDYDTPVQHYIPWFTLAEPEAAKQLTIGDLVSHRSGLSRDSGTASYTYNAGLSIEELVRSLKNVQPNRPVGKSEEYSNLNFIILAQVIEAASGMTYPDYVQKHIFDPLGMAHSYTDDTAAKKDGSAVGHLLAYGFIVPTTLPLPPAQMPAGYQQSSAEDMAKFAALYLTNGYDGGQSIIENNHMPESKPPYGEYDNSQQRYGIYWMPESGPVGGYQGYFGHEGRSSNFSTMLLVNPSSRRAIVVLTNCNNGSHNPEINAAVIANDITAMLERGYGLPLRTAGFGNPWNMRFVLLAAVLLLALRAVWAARFRKNLARGKGRRVFTLVTYAVLDGALPLAALVAIPSIFRVSWSSIFATNLELAFLVLLVSIVLMAIFTAKTVLLATTRLAARPTAAKGD